MNGNEFKNHVYVVANYLMHPMYQVDINLLPPSLIVFILIKFERYN